MAIHIRSLKQLSAQAQELLAHAHDVASNAYNRYSSFIVGAAVRTDMNKIHRGTLLENASYGLSICAETAAIAAANSAKAGPISSIAIVGGYPKGPVVTPCGRCRQLLYEASYLRGRDIEVYCSNLDFSALLLVTAEELLPHAFGPKSLSM